jgi:hypothetical protein
MLCCPVVFLSVSLVDDEYSMCLWMSINGHTDYFSSQRRTEARQQDNKTSPSSSLRLKRNLHLLHNLILYPHLRPSTFSICRPHVRYCKAKGTSYVCYARSRKSSGAKSDTNMEFSCTIWMSPPFGQFA